MAIPHLGCKFAVLANRQEASGHSPKGQCKA